MVKKIIDKIKRHIPISRGRYERELNLLRLSVSRSIEDERTALRTMIDALSYVSSYHSPQGATRLRIELPISNELYYMTRGPILRHQLLYEIGIRASRELEKQLDSYGSRILK